MTSGCLRNYMQNWFIVFSAAKFSQIKILEEEQYRRMVEAYKAELQQVTDWVQGAKQPTPRSSTSYSKEDTSSVASSNMTSVHQQLKQCKNTVLDIERKLILLSELSGKFLVGSIEKCLRSSGLAYDGRWNIFD